jgi:hypothetical protein
MDLEKRTIKIPSRKEDKLFLKVIPGHFTTNHSHINYYIDMTTLKSRESEAEMAAEILAGKYVYSTIVDTIVCIDGCDVVGAFLAQDLTKAGIMSMNAHKTIYITSPEYNTNGQMTFRDNIQPMISGKNIILLFGSATTGETIQQSIECIQYYGGVLQGISAIFSAIDYVGEHKVDSVFNMKDIPDYKTFSYSECPFCKEQQKIEAIVNSYGYTKL